MRNVPTVKAKCINKGSLCVQVTLPQAGEKRLFKNLNEKIDPKLWRKDKVDKSHPRSIELNKLLSDEVHALESGFEADRLNGTPFTEVNVLRRMKGLDSNPAADFYAFCREQIAIKNYSKETARTYESEVSKMENKYPSLSFADINYKWLQGYEKYMRSELNNHNNTVWKSLKFVNTMLNAAVKIGGIIKENSMKDYDRGNYKQGIPVYLSWDDMLLFKKVVFNNPLPEYTKLVGYYALLSYFSGLRFSDAVSFDYSKQVIHEGDKSRIVLNTKKTGEMVSILITPNLAEIIDYVKDRPIKTTNQEFNEKIKIIQGIAEIKTDLSCHSFRHGFAVRCASLGMSRDEVQKLLGHNKSSTTDIYFRLLPARLDEAMSKWL